MMTRRPSLVGAGACLLWAAFLAVPHAAAQEGASGESGALVSRTVDEGDEGAPGAQGKSSLGVDQGDVDLTAPALRVSGEKGARSSISAASMDSDESGRTSPSRKAVGDADTTPTPGSGKDAVGPKEADADTGSAGTKSPPSPHDGDVGR